MEPANILFVIAFIGIPLAFGIWALASRRELKRMGPPPRRPESDVTTQATRQPSPAPTQTPVPQEERTRQMPAAAEEPDASVQATRRQAPADVDQRTRQVPVTPPQTIAPIPQQFGYQPVAQAPPAEAKPSPQDTEELPAIQDDQLTQPVSPAVGGSIPPPQTQTPEPEPEQWSGSSGTTEEFPIVGYPEAASSAPEPTVSAPAPVHQTQAQANTAPVTTPPPRRTGLIVRRPFYPPRYGGKSAGVIKRLSPLEAQRFLAPNVKSRRGLR
jgi:hypothetical protein